MTNITLPLPEELLEAIDKARGDVPRTVWIRRAIEQRLEAERKAKARKP
jgi:metal-responsive CopG/Arc/MetJ family transcriptional regulator